MNKTNLKQQLKEILSAELDRMTRSANADRAGAIHEESRAEGAKDTRATEASYVARGKAMRVADLQEALKRVSFMELRSFGPDDPIGQSALVCVETETDERWYFIVPGGPGYTLQAGETQVLTITLQSPFGQELEGKQEGDDFDFNRGGKLEEMVIIEVV